MDLSPLFPCRRFFPQLLRTGEQYVQMPSPSPEYVHWPASFSGGLRCPTKSRRLTYLECTAVHTIMFVVLLVSLGVLALLDTTSSLLLPASVRCNGWLRTCQMVNPTIPSPRSQVLQSAQTGKPRIITASPVAAVRAPAPTGTLLSSLKTGAKLQGFVASSTPHAAFINAGNDIATCCGQIPLIKSLFFDRCRSPIERG